MFDLRTWQNPETLMLNLMNTILGVAIILVVAGIAWKAVRQHRHVDSEEL